MEWVWNGEIKKNNPRKPNMSQEVCRECEEEQMKLQNGNIMSNFKSRHWWVVELDVTLQE